MNGLALCAGVGGLERGLMRALDGSYKTVCYVEREAFAAAVLVARMESSQLDRAPIWDDIKTFDGRPWRGRVDIISGGYPCQPFSVAGKQLGDKDPRHLWPDVTRIVKEVAPTVCFFENVPGHLRLGFREVQEELRDMGYRIAATLHTAQEHGAPHKRERLFWLATDADRDSEYAQSFNVEVACESSGHATDADSAQRQIICEPSGVCPARAHAGI